MTIVAGGGTETKRLVSVNLNESDLVIVNGKTARYYHDTKAFVCSSSVVHDLPYGTFTRVVIDINIPAPKSQRFVDLVRLCQGREILVVTLVYEQDKPVLRRIVEKSLDPNLVEIKPGDVERFLVTENSPKTRWFNCPECWVVNQSVNRTKENPCAVTMCIGCGRAVPANHTPNWLE